MIFNSTNPYLLKPQVTVITNCKNKEQLSQSFNARKGKSMEATGSNTSWMEQGKKAMIE